MKVYEVEYRGVVTLSELEKAASHPALLPKDTPDLIYVRAVHERNFKPASGDSSAKLKGGRP
jgi:hypothetical protein